MPRPRPTDESHDEPLPSRDNGGKWVGWTAFAVLALVGFCFGAWAGNQRPKVIEVVKNVPAAPTEVKKPEPEKKDPEKKAEPEKKVEPEVKPPMPTPTPEPMKKTEPEATPEPKPEPKKKDPEPEPKKKEPEPSPEPKGMAVSFDKEILPIFKAKCNICHGDSKGVKGGLDLRTLAAIKKGGESGDALVAGNLMKSLIWGTIEDGAMPPPDKPQLTDAEKTKIKNWILSGGK
ncbi:MAG: c-type cytochrome domain-containing protein [Gemmataceae bacterium]